LEPAEADAASDAPPPEVQGEEEFAPEIDAQVTSQAEPVPETEAQSEASEAEPYFEPTLELSSPPAPEAEPQPKAVLVVLTSPEANLERGTRLQLPDPARLGRAEDNDIILHDRFVSAHHAEVVSVGDGFVLRDLGSTNGTFCNGVRVIGEVPLREGDRIGIGTSVFAFHGGR
jgi:pSer/pThr/pTyr-binding forkhead associated (FHA) protein